MTKRAKPVEVSSPDHPQTGTRIGYARVSTIDQNTDLQVATLKAARCDVVRKEKASGTSTNGRPELATVLDFLRKGDTLVITRIDRLARSIGDLQDIVRKLRSKGAALECVEQPVDTTTAAGKCFLDMLGVFAEFETNIRKERQMEGIAAAKAAGVYTGRKAVLDPAEVRKLRAEGMGGTAIAKQLGISRQSVYRLLGDETQHAAAPRITSGKKLFFNTAPTYDWYPKQTAEADVIESENEGMS